MASSSECHKGRGLSQNEIRKAQEILELGATEGVAGGRRYRRHGPSAHPEGQNHSQRVTSGRGPHSAWGSPPVTGGARSAQLPRLRREHEAIRRHVGKPAQCSSNTRSCPPGGGTPSAPAPGTLPIIRQITQAAPPVTATAARPPAAAGTGGTEECAARAGSPLPAAAPGDAGIRASGDQAVCSDPRELLPTRGALARPENRNFTTSTSSWLVWRPLPCFHLRGTRGLFEARVKGTTRPSGKCGF